MEQINMLVNTIKNITFFSIIDILIVSYIFYKGYMLIQETRAEQLLKGIILVVLAIPLSSFLQLTMLNWLLKQTITIGIIFIVIIFQPEIRRALEQLGRSAFSEKHIIQDEKVMETVITEIVNAAGELAKSKTGALIVIEQHTGVGDIISTGTKIDAVLSDALLENIFVVNTPLHDGATIIRNDRIISAGCFLPLTSSSELSKSLGTRHRAAIGLSENSDAIVIVVSEETGTISLAVNGRLTRNYDKSKLKDILLRILKNRKNKKLTFWERVKRWIKTVKKK